MEWTTLAVLAFATVMMLRRRQPPDAILFAALIILMSLGIVSPRDALSGFSNEGVVTIAALFVVATGLSQTGGMAEVVKEYLFC